MKLEIDGVDCTAWLDSGHPVRVMRRLNRAAELTCALVGTDVVVPDGGARVVVRSDAGEPVFTGHVAAAPEREHMGWGQAGAVYRYAIHASGDEWLLDREVMKQRPYFVMRSAGEIVREMTASLGLADLDVSGVDDCGTVTSFSAGLKRWSECAGELARQTRSAFSVLDGCVRLEPIGKRAFTLSEEDETFSPERLKLRSPDMFANDITVLGKGEAGAYVKDYFVGDGFTLRYYLTEIPFGRSTSTLLEQEYDAALDGAYWKASGAVSVNSGRVWMQGAGSVEFAELVELKGALTLQHGDVQFQATSTGSLGALVSDAGVLMGFDVAKSGAESRISAVINGVPEGSSITTVSGRRYVLSTRVFASETVREGERFASSADVRGGDERAADARVVLEVHEIDPNDPSTLVTAATALYDGVVSGIPATCRYVLFDGEDLHCSLAYTRMMRMPNVLVRSMIPGQEYRTRLTGAMMDGAECRVYNDALQFYSGSVPQSGEKIVAEYRGARRPVGRVYAPHLPTEGRCGAPAVFLEVERARTSDDCAAAAQALLDDRAGEAWVGEYETWSDFVPEVWPGCRVDLRLPSRDCEGRAIVREVEMTAADPANDRWWVSLKFGNDAAEAIGIEATEASAAQAAPAMRLDPARFVLANLPQAQVTAIASTSVTIDMGMEAIAGGGFEIRRNDSGWDASVDRNLVGRYQTRVVTAPRLSRVQTYCVRQYDGEEKYSRCATVLHVDCAL